MCDFLLVINSNLGPISHRLASTAHNGLQGYPGSMIFILSDRAYATSYTVFHKKRPFLFFIIHPNDNQFTRNFGGRSQCKNVDSHNVEVKMSKSQNVDNGNG